MKGDKALEIVRWLRQEAQFWRIANPVAKKGEALDEEVCRQRADLLDNTADFVTKTIRKALNWRERSDEESLESYEFKFLTALKLIKKIAEHPPRDRLIIETIDQVFKEANVK